MLDVSINIGSSNTANYKKVKKMCNVNTLFLNYTNIVSIKNM